ncbi:MAG: polysaccharide deacetylase family protein [Chloroflexi bacterium]|nr:polysaccharide deacetylase family protein [Chloroflexota bacterium]
MAPTDAPATTTPRPEWQPDGVLRQLWVPILMYHYVSVPPDETDLIRVDLSVTPEKFREQMQWLADNGFTTISFYDLAAGLASGEALPEKPVILTFDDGYQDNYDNAFPILQEFGHVGTFFILTDFTDRGEAGYMTWQMYEEMIAAGMSIEVHGREHLDMANRDRPWLVFTLLGAAETIEANLGYQPRVLSYPAGSYDDLTLRVAQEAGYWVAVTTEWGALHSTETPLELRRIRIRGDMELATFAAVVSDGFD